MMLHTKYEDSRPFDFRQEDFFMFPYINLCNTYDPKGEPFLTPGALLEHTW